MGRVVVVALLSGCFSWMQRDAPPRERWDTHYAEPCGGAGAGWAALLTAGTTGGIAGAILASTSDDLDDLEERSMAALLIPVAVISSIDALNAFSDASVCSDYRRYRRARRLTLTDPVRQGPADDRGDRPRERDSRNATEEASP